MTKIGVYIQFLAYIVLVYVDVKLVMSFFNNCTLFSISLITANRIAGFMIILQQKKGRSRVYRRKGDRYLHQCIINRDNHRGGSIYVWGGIAYTGKTNLPLLSKEILRIIAIWTKSWIYLSYPSFREIDTHFSKTIQELVW